MSNNASPISYRAMQKTQLLFKRFALNWQTLFPENYEDYGLIQIKYAMPHLPYCYIICEDHTGKSVLDSQQLSQFFYKEAMTLSKLHTDDLQQFVIIESGQSVRKHKSGRHAHIFIVQNRWQKTWLYTVLASKNIILAPIRR